MENLGKTSRIVQDFREVTDYEEIILSIEKYFIYIFEHFCPIQLTSRKPLAIREVPQFPFIQYMNFHTKIIIKNQNKQNGANNLPKNRRIH